MSWKNVFRGTLIVLSVLMSFSGAVNSGWSAFFPALPFMGYLLFVASRAGRPLLVSAVVFIALCISISLTRDSNPLLYPVLNGGVVTVEEDVLFVESVGSYGQTGGGLYRPDYYQEGPRGTGKDLNSTEMRQYRDFLNDPAIRTIENPSFVAHFSLRPTKITKIKKGETYPITGISHDNGDFADRIRVVTGELGLMRTYGDAERGEAFSLNKPVRSSWSYYLGNLMYWPALPALLSANLNTLLH